MTTHVPAASCSEQGSVQTHRGLKSGMLLAYLRPLAIETEITQTVKYYLAVQLVVNVSIF